jgi:murein DD-endopeptidase MepM/ murein hydrolase activator NlpD
VSAPRGSRRGFTSASRACRESSRPSRGRCSGRSCRPSGSAASAGTPDAGVDIRAEAGTPVVAAARGVVYASGWEGSYGWVVKIDHDDGFSTIYAHNLQNLVEVGDSVEAGAVIGLVGRSGRASGPHLHFELRRDGMAYNPLFLLLPGEHTEPEPGEMAAVYPAIDGGDEDGGE